MKIKDVKTGLEYDAQGLIEVAKAARYLVAVLPCRCEREACEICRLKKAIGEADK